jgi:sulfide dehydrogenase cytochrome subunit
MTRGLVRFVAILAIGVGCFSSGTQAQNASPQLLSISCAGCHGPNGHSPGTMPSIYGRTAGSIAETLRAFRADQRPATVMNRIAKGYSDGEIDAVAQEIATSWK